MYKLQHDGILQPTHDESLKKCKSYISGNMARNPFPHQVERAKNDASYFRTFTNAFSHYGYVYLMKDKHEAFETFKVFQNEVENQLGKKIKIIRSALRGEYLSHEFVLLGYALEYAARILTMVPTKKVDRTSYEIWQEANRSHRLLEASGSDIRHELIQEDDTKPSKNTSKRHNEVEPNKVKPQSVEVPICRFRRISQEPDRYGFYTDKDDTKSQSGNVFVLNDEAVDWKSAQQSTIAMSSIEFEYIDVVETSMKAVCMRKFIDGIRDVMPSNKRPKEMLCDNAPAIAIANDPRITMKPDFIEGNITTFVK
uniref:Retrotransposon protein, putative, Ty1-copia subclass n=1 Tax=Tanacetum cinerariifolium TaxID=118510 RepID=A0A6L2LHB9_TANCI|nr:retrotransposon protein, putative, Ty1-copia subclass [Tanacetum cinerariifolium]